MKPTALAALCAALLLAACGPAADPWPTAIELQPRIEADPAGRARVNGATNLPDGVKLYVVLRGGVSLGADVAEGTLAEVREGNFSATFTLDLPLDYAAEVTLAAGSNPDWAGRFDRTLCASAPSERIACLEGPEGAFRLSAKAEGRLGEEQATRALAAEHLDRLERRLKAIDYEAEQLEREIGAAAPQAALAALAHRLRIRGDKERELGLAGPERDLLYPDLDQALIEAWQSLEQLTAYRAALAAGESNEAGRLKGAPERFKRLRDAAAELLAQRRGLSVAAPSGQGAN